MKRLFCIFLLLSLSGCASIQTPEALDELPPAYYSRLSGIAVNVAKCINTNRKTPIVPYSSGDVNGGYINGRIYLSTAVFAHSDDMISFILAHEVAHEKFNHLSSRDAVRLGVTGVMLVANAFIPGVGLLNHVINPAVTNNAVSKPQELEADLAAYKACLCMGMTKERVINAMKEIRNSDNVEGGGFWAAHPPWAERIQQIQDAPEQSLTFCPGNTEPIWGNLPPNSPACMSNTNPFHSSSPPDCMCQAVPASIASSASSRSDSDS